MGKIEQVAPTLVISLFSTILFFSLNFVTVSAQESDFKIYENTDYNIKMDYPSKWKKSETNLATSQIVSFSAPEVEEKESSVSTII